MEPFGERFSKPIGYGFRHDGAIVIELGLKARDERIGADPRRDGEDTDGVRSALRRDEIRKRAMWLVFTPRGLLPEHIETQPLLAIALVGIDDDVIAMAVGG